MLKVLLIFALTYSVYTFEKTVITIPPSNITYEEGHPLVHLFCDATYKKTLHVTFEWLKDGQAINFNEHVYLENRVSGPSKIISFRNLSLTDAGKYSCRVYTTDGKNVVSEDIRHGYVGVVAKPKAPVGVKVNGDCSTFVNTYISWQPSQIFVAPVKDYVIEYAVISSPKRGYRYDPEHTMTASTTVPLLKSKLPPSAKLMFRVIAVASYNGEELMSEPSILVDKVVYRTGFRRCTTPYGPPIANPSNVQIRWLPQYNALSIVWDQIDSVHRVDGYIVGYRKLSNDTKFINKTIDGNSNTFWITNPGYREKFEIFVRSKNSRGVGPEPKIHVGSSGGPAITRKVKNLKIGSISSSSVELTWDEIDTATGYRIYYWKQLYQILTKDTNATNYFKLTGLKPSRKYKLYIVPLSGTKEGPQSQREEFVTAIGVPEAPTQVRIKVIGSSLMLSWNKPQPDHSPVISYRIECFESGKESERNAITKTVSADDRQAYITKGLQSLKYYTVKLVAVSTVGDGKSWQFDGIVLPEPDRPGKPDKPHVTSVNVSALNVTFVLPENYYGGLPDTYKVYYRLKGTDDNEKNVSGVFLKSSWLLLSNLHNKPYEIWTAGVNKLGKGASSAPVVAAPPKITPIDRAEDAEDEPFYKRLWFIILLVLVILLIVFLILVWICCTRRGEKHQVDKTEEEHSCWNDSEQLKNALETPMTTYETQERGLTKNTPM